MEDRERLERQVEFLLEADRLKQIDRRTRIMGAARRENSAEHSWHLALFALVLEEWSNEPVDLGRVLALCLVHDLVEIDAGDTFAYDEAGAATKRAREEAAADRLFGLLPPEQGGWMRAVWDEYEAMGTPESRFANAVDRMQPVLLNHAAGPAGPWAEHAVARHQVLARNAPIADGSARLWELVVDRIDEATERGEVRT